MTNEMYRIVDGEKVMLSDEEAALIERQSTLKLIAMLEEKITPRRYREAFINNDNSFIQDIENQIIKLRKDL